MTCVVGVTNGTRVWVGADSIASDGEAIEPRSDSKVFLFGPAVVGFASSYRVGQVVRYHMQWPEHQPGLGPMEFMVKRFTPALRDIMARERVLTQRDGTDAFDGHLLVGYRGQLFAVQSDFQVGVRDDAYAAIGSGAQVALGALYATPRMSPAARVRVALAAASANVTGIGGKLIVVSTR